MEPTSATQPAQERTPGRWLYLVGDALLLLGIGIYAVQFLVLKILEVPWYMPALATLGVLCVLVAVIQRFSVRRLAGLVLVVVVTAAEWLFIVWFARLPSYAGPAVGEGLPQFTVMRADGSPFTEKELATGETSVLVFFRGRW